MEDKVLRVVSIDNATHDTLRIVTNKPSGFRFTPGQAAEVAINKVGWIRERRPFTFTSLPTADSLEFTVKTYPSREGVTNELLLLDEDDELLLHRVFGTIKYKGEGIFIAGGAGITPFISILRDLKSKKEIGRNKLVFANKTTADIIQREEFEELLGSAFVSVLSEEEVEGHYHGRISEEFLKDILTDFDQHFYLCGPPEMIEDVEEYLMNLGVKRDHITKEIF